MRTTCRRSLRQTAERVLLEWDAEIPAFDVVHAEALRAREFIERAGRTVRQEPSRAAQVPFPANPGAKHVAVPG